MVFIYGRLIKYFRTEYSAARQRTCLGSRGPQVQILLFRPLKCGNSSVGRASAFQAECREFEPRFPLQLFMRHQLSWQSTRLLIVLSQVQILYDAPFFCGDGGIGRRARLRIQCPRRESSSLSLRTTLKKILREQLSWQSITLPRLGSRVRVSFSAPHSE